ncbi:unnamed protein product [Clonostachys chloroleuca]|uniref:DUF7924 domain-containing protein n=1 Tax=Clonostachys chloroleuca TaxID=1926264 RepID=A0AA35Q205_9HYPO|nr:unnamed protein product [Clonostachys chloroleuca]
MFGTRSRVRATELSAQASGQPQEPPVHERTNTIDEEQGLNQREAGQDTKVADKPPQRLYSLYEHPHSKSPDFRQSQQGERLLNWLESIKPYRPHRPRSDTNVQLLPDFYTNMPPKSTLKDSTIGPQDQATIYHSAGVSGVEPVSKANPRPVQDRGYRDTLQATELFLLEAEETVATNIQSVIDLINSECGQPPDPKGELGSQSLSDECVNMAINGANEQEVTRFFDCYFFSKKELPKNVRRNDGPMRRADFPKSSSTVGNISIPDPDLLLGYWGKSFPHGQLGQLDAWDTNLAKFAFLSVDYKGDSASTGSLWVATNQCLVATATCVRTMTKLRDEVRTRGAVEVADKLDGHVFGLVASGTEARLFVTFAGNDGKSKYMKFIRGFLLYDTSQRQDLGRCIKQIFKWAEERQGRIEAAISVILGRRLTEANMMAANMMAANTTAANKRTHDDDGDGPPTKR